MAETTISVVPEGDESVLLEVRSPDGVERRRLVGDPAALLVAVNRFLVTYDVYRLVRWGLGQTIVVKLDPDAPSSGPPKSVPEGWTPWVPPGCPYPQKDDADG